jgi:biotin synthase-related radical SAM superfamily protein
MAETRALPRREVIEKYRDVSPFAIIKADVQRRTVQYTPAALAAVDPSVHQVEYIGYNINKEDMAIPCSLMLRDGTTLMAAPLPTTQKPYVVDAVDGRTYLTDDGEIVEEVFYWHAPDYYRQSTSSGKPMWRIIGARPQRLDINPYNYCHFWDNGRGCKFCAIAATYHKHKDKNELRHSPADIAETVGEAIKQPGRFANILLTGGSVTQGAEAFDEEVDYYIEVLRAIGAQFESKRFPSQLIATAFSEKQIERLYLNTGLMSYTADLEVLNEERFNWICPGKAEWVGYREWKNRLFRAVDIFGRGRVNTGIVGGVELAKPHGFASEEDALNATLEEAETLAERGVSVVYCVWNTLPGSVFHKQELPSLEYYVRLAKGLQGLRDKYGLNIDMDNYRRCGNHPDTDLAR